MKQRHDNDFDVILQPRLHRQIYDILQVLESNVKMSI